MYTAIVEDKFTATHAVRQADGSFEEPHDHCWQVRTFFSREEIDAHDMVVDFCAVQPALRAILASFEKKSLNEHAWFSDRTPTAEVVARVIFDRLREEGLDSLRRVEVTEGPGCAAAYER